MPVILAIQETEIGDRDLRWPREKHETLSENK
jgi:hypothetical protein